MVSQGVFHVSHIDQMPVVDITLKRSAQKPPVHLTDPSGVLVIIAC